MTNQGRPLWSRLKKSELQDSLGSELLLRLEKIIPVVAPDQGMSADHLYETERLADLFEAFVAGDALRSSKFRKRVLESCTLEELDNLLSRLGVPSDLYPEFHQKLEVLAKKPWKRSGLPDALVEEFGLGDHFLPAREVRPPSEEKLQPADSPLKRLKDYQSEVFFRTWKKLEPPNGRVVMQMPTGSGKTRTAMEVVAQFLEGGLPGQKRVAWLAHSAELCDQATDAFKEVWSHFASHPVSLFRSWGRNNGIPNDPEDGWFWVSSLQMAHELRKRGTLPKADLIVVDEAHKVLAPTYSSAVRGILTNDTRVLGLTATPGRGAELAEENKALAEFFFNEKVTINAGGRSPISYLRSRDVLAELDREVLASSTDIQASGKEIEEARKRMDIPSSILERVAEDDVRSVEIAKKIKVHAEQGRSCLLFATSVEHSRFLAALLTFMGVSAAHLDGSTPSEERAYLIERFRSKEILVLCNFGVLTTGFDAPQIEVLCIARPTTSIVLYSQMLGRGLRGPAIGGTSRCRVIDVRDNILGIPELEDLYEYFDEYYD